MVESCCGDDADAGDAGEEGWADVGGGNEGGAAGFIVGGLDGEYVCSMVLYINI
jgi:hypothetical protein